MGKIHNLKEKKYNKNSCNRLLFAKGIDGTKAFYVINSDVYGPMGEELIPFLTKEDAQTFLMDHKAKKIVIFSEITKSDLH